MSIMIYNPRQFWMVSGDGPSRFRHETQLDAEREADRLARAHPGQAFFVLEAISVHRRVEVERRDLRATAEFHDEQGIPF